MKNPYVDLNRNFRELGGQITNEEIEPDEFIDWFESDTKSDWPLLEQRFRTVILAEAGSGKTREMQHRCNLLRKKGEWAFFIPLELLENDSPNKPLTSGTEQELLLQWKASVDYAWIFLDALDELKLRDGTFSRALSALKDILHGGEMRARIFVSCRPSDWQSLDTDNFKELFPAPSIVPMERKNGAGNTEKPKERSSQSRFLQPLLRRPDLVTEAANNLDGDDPNKLEQKPEELAIYRLLPLGHKKIEQFIRACDLEDPENLIREINEKDAWDFARSPQDILELTAIWREQKSLGNRTQQHEAHIRTRLRDRVERPAISRQLTESMARSGAEKLAFALALSKKRMIEVPGSTNVRTSQASSIDPCHLLSDWKPGDVKTLLNLALFDPPTFGRVQFHRRCIQEYLAACHFQNISRSGNASTKFLLQCLFKEGPLGRTTSIGSLRPISVWLAQWDPKVRRVLLDIDPELLLSDGDPEQIPLEDKARIIEKIVRATLSGEKRRLSYPASSLRRFSSGGLEITIRKIWKQAQKSEDLLGLLLSLIKEGKLPNCGDLAHKIARSNNHKNSTRTLAIETLLHCGEISYVSAIAKEFITSPEKWPPKIIRDLLADLFPSLLNISQLFKLIKSSHHRAPDSSSHLARSLTAITSRLTPGSDDSRAFINELSRLILENQPQRSAHYHAQSAFAWASPALSTLCLRNAAFSSPDNRDDFLHGCIVANNFRSDLHLEKDDLPSLRDWLLNSKPDRTAIFALELSFLCNNFSSMKSNDIASSFNAFVQEFGTEDKQWLKDITNDSRMDIRIRLRALLELVRMWHKEGRSENGAHDIRAMAANISKISEISEISEKVETWLKPPNSDPEERRNKRRELIQTEREKRRLDSWLNWRKDVISDTLKPFSEGELHHTLHLLTNWLMADTRSNSTYQIWNRTSIEWAFGKEFAKRASDSLASYWREVDYQPFSKRNGKDSETPYSWIFGLNGVLAEADSPDWAKKLSREDVRQAVNLALVEINELPSYLEQLATYHPTTTSGTLGRELSHQLLMGSRFQHLPLLQKLTHASDEIKKLTTTPLVKFLEKWQDTTAANTPLTYHLSLVIRILLESKSEKVIDSLASISKANFERNPRSPSSGQWLRALFSIDADTATTAMELAITELSKDDREGVVISWYSNIFDDFHGVNIGLKDETRRAKVWSRLSRIAYIHIRPSKDQHHASGRPYTPNARDRAQWARAKVLNSLIELDDPLALAEISSLASHPALKEVSSFLKNRIILWQSERAEPAPLSIDELRTLESNFECLPKDRNSIFEIMINRLEDIQHDVTHHDFFPRRTLRSIDHEDEMQRVLSLLLERSCNGAYSIVREDESADAKKTDIRLLSRHANIRAVIEVKIADHWGLSDFERALEAQLVGQYLRHQTCKAGCLLLTYNGQKAYWVRPKTRKRISFHDLIALLRDRARKIGVKNESVRLEVIGLDLRDPDLIPAHR